MKASSVIHKRIIKVRGEEIRETDDILAVEEPLEISLSMMSAQPPLLRKNISVTMRTPGDDTDLALGFLFTEGIIASPDQIADVQQEENSVHVSLNASATVDLSGMERHFYTSSSCGVCGKTSIDAIKTVCPFPGGSTSVRVSAALIKRFPGRLRNKQAVFDRTGGLHAAALFDTGGRLLMLREDVGRHNALDKLIGAAFRERKLPMEQHLLLLSG
ncbi:MAG: formate dehydrogenase accessory sulfurtransferase FdhD, partial [Sinomicrobium sp.]|nr:formate dehydrogenase accessory sulfurtransferase FdhD [Sinomicrobium sp.]